MNINQNINKLLYELIQREVREVQNMTKAVRKRYIK